MTNETSENVTEVEETNETVEETVNEVEEISGTVEMIENEAEDMAEAVAEAEPEAVAKPEEATETFEAAPPVSKKTTVVLLSIIVILVAVIAILAVMIVRNYRKNNPSGDLKQSTGSDSGSVVEQLMPTTAPVEPVEYNVTVELGNYMGIEVQAVPKEVSEEAVQDEIEYALNGFAEQVDITDRPVREGDVVNIDYTGYIDDVPFDGGADTGYDLEIGSHSFIDGFESGLIGHNAGETVDVEVTFPEEYGVEELNGKPALFVVVINSITEYVYPELSDEFVKENFDYDTVEEYKASVREELEGYAMEEAEERAKAEIFEKIVDSSVFGGDIDAEIAAYTEQTRQYYDQMANSYYGCDGATLFSAMYGITAEEYENMLVEETSYSVKYSYVLDKIAEAQNFEISEEEYEAEFESMFFDYYGFTSKEEVLTQITQEEMDEMVNNTILRGKAEEYVINNAVITK